MANAEICNSWRALDWPAPANVRAITTTRLGGFSADHFGSNNLALHVGDDADTVQRNRQQLQQQLQLFQAPQWLEQVHGVKIVEAKNDGRVRTADACVTTESGLACAVMTADCLPVLICDQTGSQVAAVHAGWRGLARGIVRGTLERFSHPEQCMVYLAPAISQAQFEVGVEVLEGFFDQALSANHCEAIGAAFKPSLSRPMKFHADLYALARAELAELGVTQVFGGDACTYTEDHLYYSFRRDGQTGRMASLIWMI